MNHKRGRPKSRRAGCLFCKPHKFGHGMENDLSHTPYRNEVAAMRDIQHELSEYEFDRACPDEVGLI